MAWVELIWPEAERDRRQTNPRYRSRERPMATKISLDWLESALPIIAQLRSYQVRWLSKDVTAGLAIAAVALPIGIAYPAIAGLPPVAGLYASIFPLIGYGIFGSSRQLIVGPDAATLTILAASLSQASTAGSEQQRVA